MPLYPELIGNFDLLAQGTLDARLIPGGPSVVRDSLAILVSPDVEVPGETPAGLTGGMLEERPAALAAMDEDPTPKEASTPAMSPREFGWYFVAGATTVTPVQAQFPGPEGVLEEFAWRREERIQEELRDVLRGHLLGPDVAFPPEKDTYCSQCGYPNERRQLDVNCHCQWCINNWYALRAAT